MGSNPADGKNRLPDFTGFCQSSKRRWSSARFGLDRFGLGRFDRLGCDRFISGGHCPRRSRPILPQSVRLGHCNRFGCVRFCLGGLERRGLDRLERSRLWLGRFGDCEGLGALGLGPMPAGPEVVQKTDKVRVALEAPKNQFVKTYSAHLWRAVKTPSTLR